MKKIISLALALTMALSIGATVFAATPQFETPINHDVTDTSNVIPVYGYIGLGTGGPIVIGEPGTTIIPDPENPDPDPAKLINVSVPTQIIWAAFATSGRTVQSPNYQIKNNSALLDLSVKLAKFQAKNTAATSLGSQLTLNLTGTQMAKTNVVGTAAHSYTATLAANQAWAFGISGTYNGTFTSTEKKPEYEMTLEFAVK